MLLVFLRKLSLSSQRYHTADEGVQEALHVREVEFRRLLDGDRLLQRDSREEGLCCETVQHCLNIHGLFDVCIFLASYLGILQTNNCRGFIRHVSKNALCFPPRGALTGNSCVRILQAFSFRGPASEVMLGWTKRNVVFLQPQIHLIQ